MSQLAERVAGFAVMVTTGIVILCAFSFAAWAMGIDMNLKQRFFVLAVGIFVGAMTLRIQEKRDGF
jgi:hypothetical protein